MGFDGARARQHDRHKADVLRSTFHVAAISLLVMASACANRMYRQAAVDRDGVYAFSEHARSLPTDFSGRLRVTGDSVTVLSASPACAAQPPIPLSSGQAQKFSCGAFTLFAMRHDGRWTIEYATERTVQEVLHKCIALTTTDGVQQCTATTAERRDRIVPVRGALRVIRVATPAAARTGDHMIDDAAFRTSQNHARHPEDRSDDGPYAAEEVRPSRTRRTTAGPRSAAAKRTHCISDAERRSRHCTLTVCIRAARRAAYKLRRA